MYLKILRYKLLSENCMITLNKKKKEGERKRRRRIEKVIKHGWCWTRAKTIALTNRKGCMNWKLASINFFSRNRNINVRAQDCNPRDLVFDSLSKQVGWVSSMGLKAPLPIKEIVWGENKMPSTRNNTQDFFHSFFDFNLNP